MTARRIQGTWYVDFRYERDRVRRKSPVDTKRGAEEYERTLRLRLQRGERLDGAPDKEEPTFGVFVADWLDTYAVTNNKPSEVATKRSIVRVHLDPFFGKLKLSEIGAKEIERFKALKTRAGKSAKTVNNFLTVLRCALATAEEWGDLKTIPRVKWMKVEPPPFDFLTPEESERLLAAVDADNYAIVATALKTGLRRGELLALRWEDVDLVAAKILVRRSVWKGHVTAPKSWKHREVPMTPQLVAVLKRHRHLKGPLVFCDDAGALLSKDQVKRILPRASRKAGLREVKWHMLRHTFASQLVVKGVPLKAVQELLGHSTIQMTMRYAHLAPSALRDAVSVLDQAPGSGRASATDKVNELGHQVGIGTHPIS